MQNSSPHLLLAAPNEWGFELKSQVVNDNPHQVLDLTFPGPLCHEPKMRSSKNWNGISFPGWGGRGGLLGGGAGDQGPV